MTDISSFARTTAPLHQVDSADITSSHTGEDIDNQQQAKDQKRLQMLVVQRLAEKGQANGTSTLTAGSEPALNGEDIDNKELQKEKTRRRFDNTRSASGKENNALSNEKGAPILSAPKLQSLSLTSKEDVSNVLQQFKQFVAGDSQSEALKALEALVGSPKDLLVSLSDSGAVIKGALDFSKESSILEMTTKLDNVGEKLNYLVAKTQSTPVETEVGFDISKYSTAVTEIQILITEMQAELMAGYAKLASDFVLIQQESVEASAANEKEQGRINAMGAYGNAGVNMMFAMGGLAKSAQGHKMTAGTLNKNGSAIFTNKELITKQKAVINGHPKLTSAHRARLEQPIDVLEAKNAKLKSSMDTDINKADKLKQQGQACTAMASVLGMLSTGTATMGEATERAESQLNTQEATTSGKVSDDATDKTRSAKETMAKIREILQGIIAERSSTFGQIASNIRG